MADIQFLIFRCSQNNIANSDKIVINVYGSQSDQDLQPALLRSRSALARELHRTARARIVSELTMLRHSQLVAYKYNTNVTSLIEIAIRSTNLHFDNIITLPNIARTNVAHRFFCEIRFNRQKYLSSVKKKLLTSNNYEAILLFSKFSLLRSFYYL